MTKSEAEELELLRAIEKVVRETTDKCIGLPEPEAASWGPVAHAMEIMMLRSRGLHEIQKLIKASEETDAVAKTEGSDDG